MFIFEIDLNVSLLKNKLSKLYFKTIKKVNYDTVFREITFFLPYSFYYSAVQIEIVRWLEF